MDKRKAFVLGARLGSGNIGAHTVSKLEESGWDVDWDDCAVNPTGARPAGGNMPTREIAEQHGYEQGEQGHYRRYEAPSADRFRDLNADALVITLGATYNGHFLEIPDWEISRIIGANLILPLECARRYVQTREPAREAIQQGKYEASYSEKPHSRIVFVGSYAHDHPFTNGTLYCAAKAGLDMAARTLGWELTGNGYRIHIVHPYHVNGTPMWKQVEKDVMRSKGMTMEEADAYNRKDLRMPHLLTAPEVGSVISSLLNVPEFGWMSGTSLRLYGGSR